MRIIFPMSEDLRQAMILILVLFGHDEVPSVLSTGNLVQLRYNRGVGFNFGTHTGEDEDLNSNDTPLLSFELEDHEEAAREAVSVLGRYNLTAEIRPGPPPVARQMSIVVIAGHKLRLAFHLPSDQMPKE